MTQISCIKSYRFKKSDCILVDTNVWIFLFGPNKPGDKRVETYSSALNKMIEANSQLHIDSMIISEFINTYSRIAWKISGVQENNFKSFRKSADFIQISQDISNNVKRILGLSNFISDCYQEEQINQIVTDFAKGDIDFNDEVLLEVCKQKKLIMLTDDGDFKHADVPIITANQKMLA